MEEVRQHLKTGLTMEDHVSIKATIYNVVIKFSELTAAQRSYTMERQENKDLSSLGRGF